MDTIILTSCITPAVNVAISNPVQRLAEILAAIVMWKHVPDVNKIVVVDGSNFIPPDNLGVTWLGLDTSAVTKQYGKGRSEALLIQHAYDVIKPESFWKITGRLYVVNFNKLCKLAASVQMAATPNCMGMDTRCFYCTSFAWENRLQPLTSQIDDKSSATFIERVYYDGSVGLREDLVPMPKYAGISGTRGNKLHTAYPATVLERAYERARRYLNRNTPRIIVDSQGNWLKS